MSPETVQKLASAAATKPATLLAVLYAAAAISWTAWGIVAEAGHPAVTALVIVITLMAGLSLLSMLPLRPTGPDPEQLRRRASANAILAAVGLVLTAVNILDALPG